MFNAEKKIVGLSLQNSLISGEHHGKLVYIAEYEGRSMSGQILYLIQKCIREFEKEHGPIPEDELK